MWLCADSSLPHPVPVAETEDVFDATTSNPNPVPAISAYAEEEKAPEFETLPQLVELPSESVTNVAGPVHIERPYHHPLHQGLGGTTSGNHSHEACETQPSRHNLEPSGSPLSRLISVPVQGCRNMSSEGPDPRLRGMSCEEAANILASLRGQDDHDDLWRELGCGAKNTCRVSNFSIFELMDRERSHF